MTKKNKNKVFYKFIASASGITLASIVVPLSITSKKTSATNHKKIFYDNSMISYLNKVQMPLLLKVEKYDALNNQTILKSKLRKVFENLAPQSFFGKDDALKKKLVETIKKHQILEWLDWKQNIEIKKVGNNSVKTRDRSIIYSVGFHIFGSNKIIKFNLLAYLDLESSQNNLKDRINDEIQTFSTKIFGQNTATEWGNIFANISLSSFWNDGKNLNAGKAAIKKDNLKKVIKAKLIRAFSTAMYASSFDSWVYDEGVNSYHENLSINNLLSGFDFDISQEVIKGQRKYKVIINPSAKIDFQYYDVGNEVHDLKPYEFNKHGLSNKLVLYINESPSSFIKEHWKKIIRDSQNGLFVKATPTLDFALERLYNTINNQAIKDFKTTYSEFNLLATVGSWGNEESINLNSCTLPEFKAFFKKNNSIKSKSRAYLANGNLEIPHLKIQFIEKIINPLNKKWLRAATMWRTSKMPWTIKLKDASSIALRNVKINNVSSNQNLQFDYNSANNTLDVYYKNNPKTFVAKGIPANQLLLQKNALQINNQISDSALFYKRVGDKLNVWYTNNKNELISKQILLPDADLNKKYVVKQNDNSLFVLAKSNNGLYDLKHIRFNKNQISTAQVDYSNSWITTFIAKKAKIVSAFKQGYYQNNIIKIDKTFGYSLILEKNGGKRYPLFIRRSRATNNIDTLNIGGMAGMGPNGTQHQTWLHNKNATSFDFESSFLYEYTTKNYEARIYSSDNVVEGGTDKRTNNSLPSDRNFYFIFDDKTNTILYAHFNNAHFMPKNTTNKSGINNEFIGLVVAKKSKVLFVKKSNGYLSVQISNLTPRTLGVSPSAYHGKSDIFMFYNHERIFLFKDIDDKNIIRERSKLLAFHVNRTTYFVNKNEVKIEEGSIFEAGFNARKVEVAYYSHKNKTTGSSLLFVNKYDSTKKRWTKEPVIDSKTHKQMVFIEGNQYTKQISSSSINGGIYFSYVVHSGPKISNLLLFQKDIDNKINFIGISDPVKTTLNAMPTGKVLVTNKYLVSILAKGTLITINKVIGQPAKVNNEKVVLYSKIENGKYKYFLYYLNSRKDVSIASAVFESEIEKANFEFNGGKIYIEGIIKNYKQGAINKKMVVIITGFGINDIEKHIIIAETEKKGAFVWYKEISSKKRNYHIYDVTNQTDVNLQKLRPPFHGAVLKNYTLKVDANTKEFYWNFLGAPDPKNLGLDMYYEINGKYDKQSGLIKQGVNVHKYKVISWNNAKTAFLCYDQANGKYFIFNTITKTKIAVYPKVQFSNGINLYNFTFINKDNYSLSFTDNLMKHYFKVINTNSKLSEIQYDIDYIDPKKEGFVWHEKNKSNNKNNNYYIHDISNNTNMVLISDSIVNKMFNINISSKDNFSAGLLLDNNKFVYVNRTSKSKIIREEYSVLKKLPKAVLVSRVVNNVFHYYILDKVTGSFKEISKITAEVKWFNFEYKSESDFKLRAVFGNKILFKENWANNNVYDVDKNDQDAFLYHSTNGSNNHYYIYNGNNNLVLDLKTYNKTMKTTNFNFDQNNANFTWEFIYDTNTYYLVTGNIKTKAIKKYDVTQFVIKVFNQNQTAFVYYNKQTKKYYINDLNAKKTIELNKMVKTDSSIDRFAYNGINSFKFYYHTKQTSTKGKDEYYLITSSKTEYLGELLKRDKNIVVTKNPEKKGGYAFVNLDRNDFWWGVLGKPKTNIEIDEIISYIYSPKNKTKFSFLVRSKDKYYDLQNINEDYRGTLIKESSNGKGLLLNNNGQILVLDKNTIKYNEPQNGKIANDFTTTDFNFTDLNHYSIYEIENGGDKFLKYEINGQGTGKWTVLGKILNQNANGIFYTRKVGKENHYFVYGLKNNKEVYFDALNNTGNAHAILYFDFVSTRKQDLKVIYRTPNDEFKWYISGYDKGVYGQLVATINPHIFIIYGNIRNKGKWNILLDTSGFNGWKGSGQLKAIISGKKIDQIIYSSFKNFNDFSFVILKGKEYYFTSPKKVEYLGTLNKASNNGMLMNDKNNGILVLDKTTGKYVSLKTKYIKNGFTTANFNFTDLNHYSIYGIENGGDKFLKYEINGQGTGKWTVLGKILNQNANGIFYTRKVGKENHYFVYGLKNKKEVYFDTLNNTGNAHAILYFDFVSTRKYELKVIYRTPNDEFKWYISGQDKGVYGQLVATINPHIFILYGNIRNKGKWNILLDTSGFNGWKGSGQLKAIISGKKIDQIIYSSFKNFNDFSFVILKGKEYYFTSPKKVEYLGTLNKASNNGMLMNAKNNGILVLDKTTGKYVSLKTKYTKKGFTTTDFNFTDLNHYSIYGIENGGDKFLKYEINGQGTGKWTVLGKILNQNANGIFYTRDVSGSNHYFVYDLKNNKEIYFDYFNDLNVAGEVGSVPYFVFNNATGQLKIIYRTKNNYFRWYISDQGFGAYGEIVATINPHIFILYDNKGNGKNILLDTLGWNQTKTITNGTSKKIDQKINKIIYSSFKNFNDFSFVILKGKEYYFTSPKKVEYLGTLNKASNNGMLMNAKNNGILVLDKTTGKYVSLKTKYTKKGFTTDNFDFQDLNHYSIYGIENGGNKFLKYEINGQGTGKWTVLGKILNQNANGIIYTRKVGKENHYFVYDLKNKKEIYFDKLDNTGNAHAILYFDFNNATGQLKVIYRTPNDEFKWLTSGQAKDVYGQLVATINPHIFILYDKRGKGKNILLDTSKFNKFKIITKGTSRKISNIFSYSFTSYDDLSLVFSKGNDYYGFDSNGLIDLGQNKANNNDGFLMVNNNKKNNKMFIVNKSTSKWVELAEDLNNDTFNVLAFKFTSFNDFNLKGIKLSTNEFIEYENGTDLSKRKVIGKVVFENSGMVLIEKNNNGIYSYFIYNKSKKVIEEMKTHTTNKAKNIIYNSFWSNTKRFGFAIFFDDKFLKVEVYNKGKTKISYNKIDYWITKDKLIYHNSNKKYIYDVVQDRSTLINQSGTGWPSAKLRIIHFEGDANNYKIKAASLEDKTRGFYEISSGNPYNVSMLLGLSHDNKNALFTDFPGGQSSKIKEYWMYLGETNKTVAIHTFEAFKDWDDIYANTQNGYKYNHMSDFGKPLMFEVNTSDKTFVLKYLSTMTASDAYRGKGVSGFLIPVKYEVNGLTDNYTIYKWMRSKTKNNKFQGGTTPYGATEYTSMLIDTVNNVKAFAYTRNPNGDNDGIDNAGFSFYDFNHKIGYSVKLKFSRLRRIKYINKNTYEITYWINGVRNKDNGWDLKKTVHVK